MADNDTVVPSVRCARAMHEIGLAITQPEDGLARFIAEKTGCDKAVEACRAVVDWHHLNQVRLGMLQSAGEIDGKSSYMAPDYEAQAKAAIADADKEKP